MWLFRTKVLREAFFVLRFRFVLFFIGAKAAPNLLVKLTKDKPGIMRNVIVNRAMQNWLRYRMLKKIMTSISFWQVYPFI